MISSFIVTKSITAHHVVACIFSFPLYGQSQTKAPLSVAFRVLTRNMCPLFIILPSNSGIVSMFVQFVFFFVQLSVTFACGSFVLQLICRSEPMSALLSFGHFLLTNDKS